MRFFIATAILSALIFTGCSDKEKTDENSINEKKVEKIKLIVDNSKFILKDINNEKITLHVKEKGFVFEGFEKKVVILNFFTTWCPPCNAQIPHLNNLKNRYKDNLVIISVILEDKKENNEVIEFLNANNIEFNVVNSKENFRLANHIGGVKSIPYMIIYDKDGEYFKHYVGAIPEEMIEADLKKVI